MLTKSEKNVVHLAGSSTKTHLVMPHLFFLRQQKAKLFHASLQHALQTFSNLNNFFFLHFDFSRRVNYDMHKNTLYVHIIYTACACTTRFSNLFLRASQFYSHNAIVYSIALYIHTVETLKIYR